MRVLQRIASGLGLIALSIGAAAMPAGAAIEAAPSTISSSEVSVKAKSGSPLVARKAASGSFSCEGGTFRYSFYFYLQGSGQRIAYMVGTNNNGRKAVRVWRPGGGSAYYSIGSRGAGAGWIAGPQYEYCSVRPAGADGAYVWARIPGVGTWDESFPFS